MSKTEKLLLRLQATPKPKDFTWKETASILKKCGFEEVKTSGGSRVRFYHRESDHILTMHKPHNPSVLKDYQVDDLLVALREAGCISE